MCFEIGIETVTQLSKVLTILPTVINHFTRCEIKVGDVLKKYFLSSEDTKRNRRGKVQQVRQSDHRTCVQGEGKDSDDHRCLWRAIHHRLCFHEGVPSI